MIVVCNCGNAVYIHENNDYNICTNCNTIVYKKQ